MIDPAYEIARLRAEVETLRGERNAARDLSESYRQTLGIERARCASLVAERDGDRAFVLQQIKAITSSDPSAARRAMLEIWHRSVTW